MLAYRAEEANQAAMAAEDPFGGGSVFLWMPGSTAEQILDDLARRLGMIVPAVAWDGLGAWVDVKEACLTREELLARWQGGRRHGS